MSKQPLLRVAVEELMRHGLGALSVSSLAERMGLRLDQVGSYFPGGDWQLRMDAVEHAGVAWVDEIRARMRAQGTPQEKIALVCRAYALGSRDFPASLDGYLDLWMQAREGNEEIRTRLGRLYRFYAEQFADAVAEAGGTGDGPTREAFAHLVTLLSDMLHLQRMLGNPIEFSQMGRLLDTLAQRVLLEET